MSESPQPQLPPPFPRPFTARTLLVPGLAAALGLVLIPWAEPLFRVSRRVLSRLDPFLSGTFDTAREFVGATCVGAMLIAICRLDRRGRAALPYWAAAMLLATVASEPLKQLAGRVRPEFGVAAGEKERLSTAKWLESHPGSPVRAFSDRHDQWLWTAPGRPWFDSRFSSFPSGHSNNAFLLAAFLSVLYPRVRALWLAIAVACAVSRVWDRRHFPEDVLVGGAMGWVAAYWAFSWDWPRRWGNHLGDWLSRTRWGRFLLDSLSPGPTPPSA